MQRQAMHPSNLPTYNPAPTVVASVRQTLCNFEVFDRVTRGDTQLARQLIRMYLRISGLTMQALPEQYAPEDFSELRDLLQKFSHAVDAFGIGSLAGPIEEILDGNDGFELQTCYVQALILEIRHFIALSRLEMQDKLNAYHALEPDAQYIGLLPQNHVSRG